MTAKQIAFQLAQLLDERNYSYVGVTLYLGGKYPAVTAFDLNRDIEFIVVCSDTPYDEQARRFMEFEVGRMRKESKRDIAGHLAQPHSSNPDAWVLTEWIWKDDEQGRDLLTRKREGD